MAEEILAIYLAPLGEAHASPAAFGKEGVDLKKRSLTLLLKANAASDRFDEEMKFYRRKLAETKEKIRENIANASRVLALGNISEEHVFSRITSNHFMTLENRAYIDMGFRNGIYFLHAYYGQSDQPLNGAPSLDLVGMDQFPATRVWGGIASTGRVVRAQVASPAPVPPRRGAGTWFTLGGAAAADITMFNAGSWHRADFHGLQVSSLVDGDIFTCSSDGMQYTYWNNRFYQSTIGTSIDLARERARMGAYERIVSERAAELANQSIRYEARMNFERGMLTGRADAATEFLREPEDPPRPDNEDAQARAEITDDMSEAITAGAFERIVGTLNRQPRATEFRWAEYSWMSPTEPAIPSMVPRPSPYYPRESLHKTNRYGLRYNTIACAILRSMEAPVIDIQDPVHPDTMLNNNLQVMVDLRVAKTYEFLRTIVYSQISMPMILSQARRNIDDWFKQNKRYGGIPDKKILALI